MEPKNLTGIPWMFAKAMQADGWTLRSEIIWSKPNPTPGSQVDRPTLSHEPVFMFSKSADYFYDNVAARERAIEGLRERRSVWSIAPEPQEVEHYAVFPTDLAKLCIMAGTSERGACPGCGAPWRRTVVLEVQSEETLFGSAPGQAVPKTTWRPTCVCGSDASLSLQADDMEEFETPTGEQIGEDATLKRGRNAVREMDRVGTGKRRITRYEHRKYAAQLRFSPNAAAMKQDAVRNGRTAFEHYCRVDDSGARPIPPDLLEQWIGKGFLKRVELPEWRYPEPVPCVVLDPFGGSGTTAKAALELGRSALMCEINPAYAEIINRKSRVTPAML